MGRILLNILCPGYRHSLRLMLCAVLAYFAVSIYTLLTALSSLSVRIVKLFSRLAST